MIDVEGNIKNIEFVKSYNELINREIFNVLELMSKWNSNERIEYTRREGKYHSGIYILPIRHRIIKLN